MGESSGNTLLPFINSEIHSPDITNKKNGKKLSNIPEFEVITSHR